MLKINSHRNIAVSGISQKQVFLSGVISGFGRKYASNKGEPN